MELATNTISKGLLLDVNPMIQSNDSLSDCLNGTIVTMNGNEIILQNDMGNRRVDNAFLPSGYEPVGMKEYGGIIYVAAYNPITNKSQIGSFPSPLRKVDSLDNPNLKGSFNFESFLSSPNVERDPYLEINVIRSDSFMIPLTGDISLRAGDKFAIYAPGLSSMAGDITNYNNVSGNKAYSPKNRKYTLLVGVLNSQNEFVDITKTLCRWKKENNKWSPVSYDSEKSDVFKFNDGYFISDEFTDKLLSDTINDTKLIKKRLKMAANTYSYKLIGPMYLKVNLNHIENFNYNIYGIRNDDGSATLWIEGYISYNCPDGLTGEYGGSNEDYVTFSEGRKSKPWNFIGFKLIGKDANSITRENSVYNTNTNLYSLKMLKRYDNITSNMSGNIFEYTLGVCVTSNIYLRGLSVKGLLDLDLLGSGRVFVNGWRFYNNFLKESTTLTFSFNAYPEYNKSFGNLKFNFKDITKLGNANYNGVTYPKEGGLPLYNGRQTYDIDWEGYFEPRKTYKVTITYNVINSNGTSTTKTLLEDTNVVRWLLTTELFNDFYLPSAGVPDFCNLNGVSDKIKNVFNNKMKVNLKAEEVMSNNSVKDEDDFTGAMTSTEPDIEYTCKHNYRVDIDSNPVLKIVDENLYPDYIIVRNDHKRDVIIDSTHILKIGSVEYNSNYDALFKSLLPKIRGSNINSYVENTFNNLETLNINLSNSINKVFGNITYYDRYFGYSESGLLDVENVFDTVENLVTSEGAGPTDGFFGCILVNFDSHTGPDDDHIVDVYHNKSSNDSHVIHNNPGGKLVFDNIPGDSDLWGGGYRVYNSSSDSTQIIQFKDIASLVYGHFDSGLNGGQMFMYMFPSYRIWYDNITKFPDGWGVVENRRGDDLARVWWRTSDNEWALFKDMIKINETFADYIKRKFGNRQYVYCMYNTYLGSLSSIHATKDVNAYYDTYSIPLIFSIDYKIKPGSSVQTILNTDTTIGNLVFSGNSEILNMDSSLITFNLDSSLKFLDTVKFFDINSIKNVDIATGLMTDSLGRALNKNYIYYIETLSNNKKRLVRLDNTYMLVDFENTIAGKNTLVYNRNTFGVPDYRYDHCGNDSDDHTLVDYNLTNIVQGI